MNQRCTSPAALVAMALIAWSPLATGDPATVRVPTGNAELEIAVPAHIMVGQSPMLSIAVSPTGNAPAPTTIRVRLGMPAHGHWITAEAEQPAAGPGTYRFEAMDCGAESSGSSGDDHAAHGGHGATATMAGHDSEAKMAHEGHGARTSADSAMSHHGALCLDHGFETLYPMAGTYRLRIWLVYEDGRTVKSGVDMDVESGKPLSLRPAP